MALLQQLVRQSGDEHGVRQSAGGRVRGREPDRQQVVISADRDGDCLRTAALGAHPVPGGERLASLRKSIDQLERRLELEGRRDGAGKALDRARSQLAPLRAQHAEAREASRRCNAALQEAYRDPRTARREFHARVRDEGVSGAAMEMARQPGRFGELRGTGMGPLRSAEMKAALQTAARLEPAGTAHLRATSVAWDGRQEYRAARSNVGAIERQVRDLDSVLAGSPGSAELKLRLTREIQRLQPRRRQALHRSLPITKGQVLTAALVATHAFAREQRHER